MKVSFFIAKRLIKSSKQSNRNSQTIIKIATVGTVLSTVIMILTLFISFGFKQNILEKVSGFASDFQIINYDANQSFDYEPIKINQSKIEKIKSIKNINSVSGFITKPAIIKHKNSIEGIVLKSYSNEKDYGFFESNLIEGRVPKSRKNEILISEDLSKKLNLKIGQSVIIYFIQDPIRYRKLRVSGLYKTDIYEFDHTFSVVDPFLLKKINSWTEDEVSGYEIKTNSNSHNSTIQNQIEQVIKPQYFSKEKDAQILLKTLSTKDRYPQFYYWFDLFDTNIVVIISLMIAVALINLISALLIVIIENTTTVGLLKSFGIENQSLRSIFMYFSAYMTIKGIFFGNIIALILAFIQFHFQILPLDAENYYISYVPIGFDWHHLILLDIISILLIISFLIIPINYISKISPVKVIRFN